MRLEEINKAAEEMYGTGGKSSISKMVDVVLSDLKNAFVEGALWSDDHPNLTCYRAPAEIPDMGLDLI